MWNFVYFVMGYTRDEQMETYPTALAAYNASRIESHDPLAAPPGAMHYWANPADAGHVAVELGGGLVLMTGTPGALGDGGKQYGNNYGVTTVAAYSRARGNPYRGWSLANGKNESVVGKFGGNSKGNKVTMYSRHHRSVREIKPGQRLYSVDSKGRKQNCVGPIGIYDAKAHVYGKGFAPGDMLYFRFERVGKDGKPSGAHEATAEANRNGEIKAGVSNTIEIRNGDSLHLTVYASSKNKGVTVDGKTVHGRIELLDSDTLHHVKA